MTAPAASIEADIWERMIHPRGTMSKSAARRIIEMSLTDEEAERARVLAKKNRRGELTDEEESELDHLCRVGTLLSILKVRARRVLNSGAKGG